MSRVCVAVLVFAAAGACGAKPATRGDGPTRAGNAAFPDNPMLAFVPADTPYALATFKPVPPEFVHTMAAMFGPIMRREYDADRAKGELSDEDRETLEWLGSLDARQLTELGFSTEARFVIYGLGPYPVARLELANGDKVFARLDHLINKGNDAPDPPTVRAGRRYWIHDEKGHALFLAIAPRELVFAVAPRRVLEGNLAALLGEQPPASHLTTAQFRELAGHHGFTAQGVGFVDIARSASMASEAGGATPECRAAIGEVARRAPRLVLGFDDFTAKRFAMGIALELAPDLQQDVRGLSSELVGYERLVEQKPKMALALALDIDRGRALLTRVAAAWRSLGERCREPRMVVAGERLAEVTASPLPSMFAGLRGGFVAVNDMKMGPGGPASIDGYGMMQGDHIDEILKLAAGQMPGASFQPDGKAHALPAMIPYRGHVAASPNVFGFALGSDSEARVNAIMSAKQVPAPLALLQFDYGRLADLVLALQPVPDEDMRDVLAHLGLLTVNLSIAERGPSCWVAFELR